MIEGQLIRRTGEVLEWLLWEQNIEKEPHEIRAALTRVMPMDEVEEPDWYELITLAGKPLGLRTRIINFDVSLLARTRSFFPAYCFVSAETGWVGVLERKRSRYRIVRWNSISQERWVTEKELLELFHCSRTDERAWLLPEVNAPLDTWTTKKQDTSKVWTRLRGLVLSERRELWALVFYAMGIGIFSLATPIAVQSLVNTVAFGTLLQPLVVLTLMLAAGLIFLAMMQGMQIYLAEMISRRVFARVVADFSYRLPRIKPQVFQKKSRTEIANYFFDVLTVQKVSAVLLFDGLTSVLVIVSGLLLLALYHPILLVFDLLLVLAIFGVIYILGRGAIDASLKKSKLKHKTAAWLNHLLHHPLMFKASMGMTWAQHQAELLTRNYLRAREKVFSIIMRQVIAALAIQVIASTGLLLVGGWLVIKQQLTLGQLVAAELIVSALVASLFKVIKMFEKFYGLLASLEKLGTVTDLETERKDGDEPPPVTGPLPVEFSGVSVVSPLGRNLLDRQSFYIPPGSRIAITGSNTAGKSAIADVLFGLQQQTQGQVRIDEQAVQDLRLSVLRQQVALVREISFVEGSILDNLALGNVGLSRAQARRALRTVGLLDEVLELPQGLQTQLMSDGFPLTAKQQYQLVLARAIATQPNVLIVDGVLDSFAPNILGHLAQMLCREQACEWTTLFLTNRQAVMQLCDQVWLLESNTLEEYDAYTTRATEEPS